MAHLPIGWKGWWLTPNKNHDSRDFYQNHPNNCYDDAPEDCIAWHNPEFRDTKGVILGPPRIHSGNNSLKYFTLWSVHEAGVLQTVAVPPGDVLRLSAWMHAWSTDQDGREEIPTSYLSSGQTSMHMKVGIDPCGGEDPWSPNVVWGPEHDSYDQFGYYEGRATAQCDKVTVITHSMPENGKKHNDVYADDAELVVIDASGVVQPAPALPQSAPQSSSVVNAAPAPTALPRPDRFVMAAFGPGGGSARASHQVLWRLEVGDGHALRVLLQSNAAPDWTHVPRGYLLVIDNDVPNPATKDIGEAWSAIDPGN